MELMAHICEFTQLGWIGKPLLLQDLQAWY